MADPTLLRGVLLTKRDRESLAKLSARKAPTATRVSKADALAAIKAAIEPIEARLARAESDADARLAKREALRKIAEQLLDLDEQIAKIKTAGGRGDRIPIRKAYAGASLAKQIEKLGVRGSGSRSRWAGVV